MDCMADILRNHKHKGKTNWKDEWGREKEEILVKKNIIFTAFDASLTFYQNAHIPVKTTEMNEKSLSVEK